jgi:hypothetical protein
MATVQTLIDEVREVIHDTVTTYRWSDSELIDYCNAGIRQTVVLVPESNATETVATVSNNIARQAIPSGGIKFIKVSRNYADDGTTAQGPVRYAEKDALDSFVPDWEYNTAAKADAANFFEHYCHDPREPKVYYLYPVQSAANKRVAIVYSFRPTAHTLVSDTFALDDEYINAVVQYMIFRSLTKESRDSMPVQFRSELWANYLAALGLHSQAMERIGPESNMPPEAP